MTTPSRQQLAYLRALADRTGTTFTYPHTGAQASDEIDRLRAVAPLTRHERRSELARFDRERVSYSTSPQPWEITGYGSSATWRTRGR